MKEIMIGNSLPLSCSIVIRAYNEEETVARLLEGITQQTVKNVEVVVVDSGSTDNTVRVAEKYHARVIKISPDQFSFGRSLNLGIKHCNAEIIIIASAHIYPVYPDWIEKLLLPFQDKKVALAYGKQRGNLASFFSERQIFQRWYPDQSNLQQKHPFCNNANAAIRKSLWLTHPYDEILSGLEDIAWSHWVVEQGYSLAYIAEAEVVHIHSETPEAVRNRYYREAMAFKRIFPHETFSLLDFARLVVTNITSDLWHAYRNKELFSSLSSIFWFRWMQFRGTYQGYRQSGPLTWQLRQTFYYPHGITNQYNKISRDVEPIRYNE